MIIFVFSAVMVAQGLLNVAFVAIAADIGGAGTYGAIIAAQGLGSIAGSRAGCDPGAPPGHSQAP